MADRGEAAIARNAFDEIGPDLATLIDSWVYEAKLTALETADFPTEPILSALLQSGLVRRRGDESIELLPFKNRELWLAALSNWISTVITPPLSWSRVASELFSLERLLRQEAAQHLESRDGPAWRTASLGMFEATILELARRAMASRPPASWEKSAVHWIGCSCQSCDAGQRTGGWQDLAWTTDR